MARGDRVPAFSLYGEQDGPSDLEFIHIEDIRSRSEQHEWEIGTHLHKGLFQTLFVLNGSAEAILDETVHKAAPGSVVVIPPGTVHSFRFEPDTDGYVLTLAEALPIRLADSRSRQLFETLSVQARVVEMGADAERCRLLLAQISQEARELESGHLLICEWLVAATLMLIARRAAEPPIATAKLRSSSIFARFRAYVEARYRDHLSVADYAKALSVSETRLDRICRSHVHQSAFELVQERLMLEARRTLVHVEAPVSVIARELGFKDPAYFCRIFRKRTGQSPTSFRKSQRQRLETAARLSTAP